MNQLRDLPNFAGYRFWGVKGDGSLVECVVLDNSHHPIITGRLSHVHAREIEGWEGRRTDKHSLTVDSDSEKP